MAWGGTDRREVEPQELDQTPAKALKGRQEIEEGLTEGRHLACQPVAFQNGGCDELCPK
jgi:hypothetical protein